MSPAKKFVCSADGRAFVTKAALAQHRRDAHPSGKSVPVVSARRPVRNRRTAPSIGNAPNNMGSSVRGGGTDIARLSGVDRVFHGDITTAMKTGSKVCDLLVSPGLFARLKVVSQAYQRIRYLRCVFRVETQMNTLTAGGYIAGYVRDPADDVSTLNGLMSQQGSIATKWWQSSVVSAPPPARLFYTSESVESREFSPGRFLLYVDGPATQNGSVTVYAEWTAELSEAGLENPSQLVTQYTMKSNWYVRSGHQGFWNGRLTSASPDVSDLINGAVSVGMIFKVERPFAVTQMNGNVRTVNWVKVDAANTLLPCYEWDLDVDKENFKVDDLVATAGSLLEDVTPKPVTGEELAPSSSDFLTTMAASERQLKDLVKGLTLLLNFLPASENCSLKDCQESLSEKVKSTSGGSSN